MIDISIIIPVYNVEQYVEGCLQSVMAQEGINDIGIECLIVDDRGTDNSMAVVQQTLREYNGKIDFRIIEREKNGGLSAARNSGIMEARGKYVYFLDSDDTISLRCISILWQRIKENPGINMVLGKTVCTPDPKVMKRYFDFEHQGIPKECTRLEKAREYYLRLTEIMCNRLIDLDWMVRNGLYFKEGIIHEDFHWHLMSYQYVESYACAADSLPTYYYLQRSGSIMKNTGGYVWLNNISIIYQDVAKKNTIWPSYLMHKISTAYFDIIAAQRNGVNVAVTPRQLLSTLLDNQSFTNYQRILLYYLKTMGRYANIRICNALIRLLF